jgi:hypothetical protein
LQVALEKQFFHWITHNSLKGLFGFDILHREKPSSETAIAPHFYMHRSHRYPKRQIKEALQIIKEYSQDHITRSCGQRAENLFSRALLERGFSREGAKVSDFNGKNGQEPGMTWILFSLAMVSRGAAK